MSIGTLSFALHERMLVIVGVASANAWRHPPDEGRGGNVTDFNPNVSGGGDMQLHELMAPEYSDYPFRLYKNSMRVDR